MKARLHWLILGGLLAVGTVSAADDDQVREGQKIFRFDTFGDEQLWTDKLGLHRVVQEKVDPATALAVGLKVDADALPPGTLEKADLKDPKTTVALLKMNAVVGLKAQVDANNQITRLGVTCALCHSTVDDSVKPGIGKRMDGWPNRDLDVGKIISLSPALTDEQKKVYTSWGPGKYDPRYNQDGKNTPLVLPPAYGLAKVKNETYTAEGPISYWNAYVAVTQMGGHGNFKDAALKIDVKHSPDMVTSKLPALRAYQHSLVAPKIAASQVDAKRRRAARRCSTRTARAATSAAMAPTMTAASCIPRVRPGRTAHTRSAPRPRRTAPRRCADCGSTRRISMTAAPRSWTTWWTTTTTCASSSSLRPSARSWWSTSRHFDGTHGGGWRRPPLAAARRGC